MPLPPGPTAPAPLTAARFVARPLDWLLTWQRRFGDAFTVRLPIFGTGVYVADPGAIKELMTADPSELPAGEANRPLEPWLGRRSVILLDGPEHMRQRKLLLPPFHGDALRGYEAVIEDVTRRAVARWGEGEGEIEARREMREITFEVIARTVFGVVEPDRIERLRAEISRLIAMDWALVAPAPLRLPFLRQRRRVDRLLREEIERRRGRPGDDVLSILLSARDEDGAPMTDEELRDELMTVLAAGHETTATGLAWAFDLLSRHPGAVARIRSGDPDYLEAAVKEVLRVRPVIDAAERLVKRPRRVLGFTIPAGTRVYPAIALAQLRPQSYPEPFAFRPERFLNGGAPEPYTWLPFGGGIRRCVGAAFAQLEMRTVIRTVLERVEIEPARRHPERAVLRGVTLVPANGAPVRARKMAV